MAINRIRIKKLENEVKKQEQYYKPKFILTNEQIERMARSFLMSVKEGGDNSEGQYKTKFLKSFVKKTKPLKEDLTLRDEINKWLLLKRKSKK